jgi:hypothetical protein
LCRCLEGAALELPMKRLPAGCGADISWDMRPPGNPWIGIRSQTARPRPEPRLASTPPIIAAALGALLILATPSHAQSPIIQGWLAANTVCKGGPSDDPKAQKACARRDEIGARLKRRGCEYQEDGDWWRCPH